MSRTARNTLVFSGLTLTSRLTGLLRNVLLAAALGGGSADRLSDSYLVALTLPMMIYEFVMGGLLTAIFLPTLVQAQQRHGRTSPDAWRVANLLLGGVGVLLAVASFIAMLASPQIIAMMTSFARDTTGQPSRELAAMFFRVFAWQILLQGISAVFMAVLNSHERFTATASAPIANNLVAIITFALFHAGHIGVWGLALGTTAGAFAQCAVMVPSLLRAGMPIRPSFNIRDPLFRSVGALGAPLVVLSVATIIGAIFRTNLLYAEPGGFTAYTFCFQLIMMPYGIVAVSIATVLFPTMSRHWADGKPLALRETMTQGLRWTTFIMLPVAVGLALLAEPIARVLFERGKFRAVETLYTAEFLTWYAPSILPFAIIGFLTRVFYSMGDTRTPTMINVGGVVLNIALNFALMSAMGAKGVALASGLTHASTTLCAAWVLSRRLRGTKRPTRDDLRDMLTPWLRMAACAVVMGGAVWLGWHAVRAHYTVIDARAHLPFVAPQSASNGNALLARDGTDLGKLAEMLAPTKVPRPFFRTDRGQLALIIGPMASTTTTLRIATWDDATSGGARDARVLVDVYRETTGPQLARPQQAMLLVRPLRNVESIEPEFRLAGEPPRGLRRIISGRDFLALLFLIPLGAIIYATAALILRCEETRFITHRLPPRWRGALPSPKESLREK